MAKLRFQFKNRDRCGLIHQAFFQPADCEVADDEDKRNNVKHIEQQKPIILACANRAGNPDRMRKRQNLRNRPNIARQIGNRKHHTRKEKHRRDKTREVKIEMVNRPHK